MIELLSELFPGDLAFVLLIPSVILLIGLIVIVSQVIQAYQRNRERETAGAAVAEMLDRGMGSEEIIAVLKAMGLESTPESKPDSEIVTPAQRIREFLAKRFAKPTA